MSRLRTYLLTGLVFFSCANKKLDRLSDAERECYDAVRVWMDAKEIKAYLKLKTEEERNQWLKDHKLYDRWYGYDERIRQAIRDGRVTVGMAEDMVLMAWGAPTERRRNTGRPAQRSETLVYRFEVSDDGEVLVWAPDSRETQNAVEFYRMHVVIDDGVVAEIEKRKGWDD
jgi:hypothetical protein